MSNKIAPALKDLAIPIAELWSLPDNPREGDVGAVAVSLDRLGQRKPIVTQVRTINRRKRRVVIAGNHTLAAARSLGWDMIAVVDADDLSTLEGDAYAIADNRTSDRATYDSDLLASALSNIASAEDLLEATGYDGDDIDVLLAPPPPPGEFPEFGDDLPTDHTCPQCGYEFSD